MLKGHWLETIRKTKGNNENVLYEISDIARILRLNPDNIIDLENGELSFSDIKQIFKPEEVANICLWYEIKPKVFFSGESPTDDFVINTNNYYDAEMEKRIKRRQNDIYQDKPEKEDPHVRKIKGYIGSVLGLSGVIIMTVAGVRANSSYVVYVNDLTTLGEIQGKSEFIKIPPDSVLFGTGKNTEINMGDGISQTKETVIVPGKKSEEVVVNTSDIRRIGKVKKMKIKNFRFLCKRKDEDDILSITNGIVNPDGTMPVYSIYKDSISYDELPADTVELLEQSGLLIDQVEGVLEGEDGKKHKAYIDKWTPITTDATYDMESIDKFTIPDGELKGEKNGEPDGTFWLDSKSELVYNPDDGTFTLKSETERQ